MIQKANGFVRTVVTICNVMFNTIIIITVYSFNIGSITFFDGKL